MKYEKFIYKNGDEIEYGYIDNDDDWSANAIFSTRDEELRQILELIVSEYDEDYGFDDEKLLPKIEDILKTEEDVDITSKVQEIMPDILRNKDSIREELVDILTDITNNPEKHSYRVRPDNGFIEEDEWFEDEVAAQLYYMQLSDTDDYSVLGIVGYNYKEYEIRIYYDDCEALIELLDCENFENDKNEICLEHEAYLGAHALYGRLVRIDESGSKYLEMTMLAQEDEAKDVLDKIKNIVCSNIYNKYVFGEDHYVPIEFKLIEVEPS